MSWYIHAHDYSNTTQYELSMPQISKSTHNSKKNLTNTNMGNSEEDFLRISLQDDNHETDEWIDLKHGDQLKSDINMIKNTNSCIQSESYDSKKDFFRTLLEICQISAESFYMLTRKWDHEIFTVIMKNIKKALKSKTYVDSQFFVSENFMI